jgi:WD40 repeat protein
VVANAAEAFPKGTAYVWSAETGRQVSSHQVDYSMTATSNRYAAAFTPDGNRVATIDYTDVSVWDVASGKAISTTRAGEFAGPSGLAFSPDGEKLVGVGGAGVADVWANKREATWVRQLPSDWLGGRAPRTGRVEGACFVDGSRWVLLAANFGATGVYDLETGRRTWDITTQGVAGQKSDEVPAIAVSGDGRRLAAGLASTDETTVWSLEPPPGRLKRAQ